MSFPPAFSRRFAILIALGQRDKYRAVELRAYWKQVFFMITSPILSLSSAPHCAARKSLLESQLKSCFYVSMVIVEMIPLLCQITKFYAS
jgi:hypothetical protein